MKTIYKKKKDEHQLQKILQDKISTFENRLKETEKLNSEKLDLNGKIKDYNKQIQATSESISNLNNDIEEKTNYLEKKINSYNNTDTSSNQFLDKTDSKKNNIDIVAINSRFEKPEDTSKEQFNENSPIRKNKFFSSNFNK